MLLLYCDVTAEREVISSEHKEKCHKFPLTCPNKCGLNHIPRGDMDGHKEVCPFEVIQCEYQCGAMIARNEMDQHNKEKMTEHIRLTFKETTIQLFSMNYIMKLGLCVMICLHIKMFVKSVRMFVICVKSSVRCVKALVDKVLDWKYPNRTTWWHGISH